jgi:hypothetical protein
MTAVDVLGSVDELTDGTGGSVDVVTEVKIGPCRKSRRKSAVPFGGCPTATVEELDGQT